MFRYDPAHSADVTHHVPFLSNNLKIKPQASAARDLDNAEPLMKIDWRRNFAPYSFTLCQLPPPKRLLLSSDLRLLLEQCRPPFNSLLLSRLPLCNSRQLSRWVLYNCGRLPKS